MRIFDILILGSDLVLFGYFTQIALETTNITVRIIACLAMTAEIFFMRQHIKLMKLTAKNRGE